MFADGNSARVRQSPQTCYRVIRSELSTEIPREVALGAITPATPSNTYYTYYKPSLLRLVSEASQ